MEGLIKGLVHVAIDAVRERDHGRGGGDDGEAPRRRAPQRADPDADGEEQRDERSRSTWAEVRATCCFHLRMRMRMFDFIGLGCSKPGVVWLPRRSSPSRRAAIRTSAGTIVMQGG